MSYDVITLGETMLRLTPPLKQRLVQTTTFDIEIGGTESNTAVGLAQLGLNVAWLSRLPRHDMGQKVAEALRRYGVDTSHITWVDEGRVGIYFLEEGAAPRATRVVYDRAQSAISLMQPAELPTELFEDGKSRLFHVTGITVAVGEGTAATALLGMQQAKAAGWMTSFDFNYRSKLWSPAEAQAGCDPLAKLADILFCPVRDVGLIFGGGDMPVSDCIALLRDRYPQATIVLTMGAEGSIAAAPGAEPVRQGVYPAETVDRLGGGDAFAAGFLYGYLTYNETPDRLARALRWGAAMAALKYTIPGDLPLITRGEVEALLATGGGSIQR